MTHPAAVEPAGSPRTPGRPRLPAGGLALAQLACWAGVLLAVAVAGSDCDPTSLGCSSVGKTSWLGAITFLPVATTVVTPLAAGVHALLLGDPGMRWAGYPVRVLAPTVLAVRLLMGGSALLLD